MKRIAVIGGGPKAAAISAKAHCINLTRRQLEVRLFEKAEWGGAWTGTNGYTDGEQRLCTPVERDVGFPYGEGLLNAGGVRTLFQEFSWSSFLVEADGNPEGYRNWVDRGRKPPPHGVYAAYLAWVIKKARVHRTNAEVTAVDRANGKWTVIYRRGSQEWSDENFDAVVFTGTGPAIRGFAHEEDPRIIDGVSFWVDPKGFLARAESTEEPIVIAGSGGTSAAIAAWIVREKAGRPVLIIGNQAALFTRTESFFENALFSDEEAWAALNLNERVGVTQRLTRGVVWASVSEILSASRDVRFRPGRVEAAVVQPAIDGAPAELRVEVKDALGSRTDPACLIIDAAGFNAWWFADILPDDLRQRTVAADAEKLAAHRRDLCANMRPDLSLDLGADGLHAPMLSQAQGPGFASLMVLGGMSERILRPYVDPVT